MDTRAPRGSTAKVFGAFASLFVVVIGEVVGYVIASLFNVSDVVLPTLCGAIAGVGMLCALGGGSFLKPSLKAIKESFSFLKWIFIISVVLMGIDLVGNIASGEAISPNVLPLFLETLVLCLCIGVAEEAEFRGIVLGGLMIKLGGKKKTLMLATITTAVLFGAAHITWSELVWTDPLSLAQAALKVCQTGMYSVMLTAVMLKTRNITGAMLFHAADDFLLFVVSTALFGGGFETEYVTTASQEEALYSIGFYVVICALYAPTFVKSLRWIRREAPVPDFGPLAGEKSLPQEGEMGFPQEGGIGFPREGAMGLSQERGMGLLQEGGMGFPREGAMGLSRETGAPSESAPIPGYAPAPAYAYATMPGYAPAPGSAPTSGSAPEPGFAPSPGNTYASTPVNGSVPTPGFAPAPENTYVPASGYGSAPAPYYPPAAAQQPLPQRPQVDRSRGPVPPDGLM